MYRGANVSTPLCSVLTERNAMGIYFTEIAASSFCGRIPRKTRGFVKIASVLLLKDTRNDEREPLHSVSRKRREEWNRIAAHSLRSVQARGWIPRNDEKSKEAAESC